MAHKVLKPIKAKKSPRIDRTYEVLCNIEAGLAALHVDLDRVVAAQTAVVNLLEGSSTRDRQHEKVEMFVKQLVILEGIRDGQKALTDTLLLLTAKGVTKAREKKEPVTPQAITEQVNQAGRDLAAEQRATQATPPVVEEKKAPDLKVVREDPSTAPTFTTGADTAKSAGPTADTSKPAPTLEQLKTSFLNYVARNTREKGIELLKNFGAQKVTDVPPSQYERFSAACS